MNIYNKIVNNEAFCFVRINDGEVSAIISDTAFASRGDEQSSPELSNKLLNILSDTWYHSNLFIGVPCISCYHECYNVAKNELVKSKPYSFIENNIVDANILINNNYDKTLDVLINNIHDVIVICNENSHIDRLSRLNINVTKVYTVSSKFAFSNDYHKLKDLTFPDGSFIITLCGPLGRILAYEWFKQNNNVTCLDLGSFFDPLIRNKSYLYHTNNHKYCYNCYPTADARYTNIFKYCSEYVDKECYYLSTIQDHNNLYNYDYNRIILNMSVRLEKDPYNLDLHKIMTYCKIQICGFDQNNLDSYKKIIEICKQRNPKKVLNLQYGPESVLFLENTSGYVTSIGSDTKNINLQYDKHFIANSIDNITDIFDLIYIHNYSTYNDVISAIINCYYRSTAETIVIIHKLVRSPKLQDNLDIVNAYDKCINDNLIYSVYQDDNTSIGIFKYNWSEDILRSSNILCKSLGRFKYITNLIDTSNDLEFKKISTYIEEIKLLKLKKRSNEGYLMQVIQQFEDLIEFCNANNFNNVLEIGYLHGSSALMFLMNTTGTVTSIDYIENKESETYLQNMFPNKFNMLHGHSSDVLQTLDTEYDLIYIDGGHEYKTVKKDLELCKFLSGEKTYIIMNDVVLDPEYSMFWNDGPTRVFKEIINQNDELSYIHKLYHKGRGLVIFTLKKKEFSKEDILHLSKEEMCNEIIIAHKYNNIKKLNILARAYIEYYSILIDNEEYYKMKFYGAYGSYNQIEKIIEERFIPDSIKKLCIEYLNYDTKQIEIPKLIHFIYINQRPLKDYNYKCIYSAINNCPNYQIIIHNDIEPDTEEWSVLKNNTQVKINKIERIKIFDGYNINHVQYESDIIRLKILYEYGGIYLDNDVYVTQNLDSLLTNANFYISKETENNLINCALISSPQNEFINIWMSYFSMGFRMNNWGWHIRDLPNILFKKYPHYLKKYNIEILEYITFCPIHWTQGHLLSDPNFIITKKTFGIHLFETILGNLIGNSTLF